MFGSTTLIKIRTTASFEMSFHKDPMVQVVAVEGVASAKAWIAGQHLAKPAAALTVLTSATDRTLVCSCLKPLKSVE